ncbi:MAG TPA: ribonuclease E inhibitor RraB [Actinomycetota bacterium]
MNEPIDDTDRSELSALQASLGIEPVQIAHYFSSPGHRPDELADELRGEGFDVILDEELTGDGFWHAAALRREALTESALSNLKTAMRQVAERYRANYDGWDWRVTAGLQLRFPKAN